ncbi:MAG TPA: isoprenylcysteine carboxylmethyltransferase family protein [Hyphomicrobium sp.]|nr:isoprenylcysteine carboxylmethyltransferase family protein [Hyphomicrobium sp.]
MTNLPENSAATPAATLPWPPILLVGVVAAAIALGSIAPLAWPGEPDLMARIAGRGIGLAGLALLAWAASTLRRHQTPIRPDRPASVLVTDGPFRFRRHPIYIAHVLVLLGVAELTQNIWFVILAFAYAVLVTWLAILPEERHLEERFGEAYLAYKARTRLWI